MNDIDYGGTMLEYMLWLFGMFAAITIMVLVVWYIVPHYYNLSRKLHDGPIQRFINNTRERKS